METVLVTGGTGLVGSRLINRLLENYNVLVLSRGNKKDSNLQFVKWDLNSGFLEKDKLNEVDHIIHLAGTNVAEKKWSAKQKQSILDSRVKSTQLLFDHFSLHPNKLKTFITASGVGAYGYSDEDIVFDEDAPFGDDFLANVCKQWEKVAFQFKTLGVKTVALRTGVVLAERGSALQKIAKPIKMFVGAPIGSGKQQTPYIHVDDLTSMYIQSIKDENLEGIYNAVSGNITNSDLTKAIAKQLKRPLISPNIPAFVMKAIFGEMSFILLKGNKISNQKAISAGFQFKYDSIEKALKHLL